MAWLFLTQKVVGLKLYCANFDRAVDIGAGTGNTTAVVENERSLTVNEIKPVDQHTGMTRLLQERFGGKHSVAQASAEALPLSSGSFDLAYSQGLVFHLDRTQTEGYFQELNRILEDGGVYVDAYGSSEVTASSWKSVVLKDIIVDTVTDRFNSDGLGASEQEEIARANGFNVVRAGMTTRAFVKGGHLQDRGFPYYNGHGVQRIFSIEA